MKEYTVDMQDLHAEHLSWKNDLEFYLDDLGVLTHRLEEIATGNPDSEAMRWVEHFQNQFIRQREVNDEIRHQINVHEDLLVRIAKTEPGEHGPIGDHRSMRSAMDTYKQMFKELKSEFMAFAVQAR
ncbi:MAG TPA: hypothetical protein P5275_19920 [Saprospiraceae bacterium]|nr:hypothetical protein [Saprospiraceae bacterium]MCB9271633.1 hypothetical protein [Lewinellaceae bacterium]HPG08974.1 hypothetical protein [Saprospiraceae bacterium]HPR00439.1 hypothetical protein [Saprospiraceae bacterium]HQU54570.1 hypothetical protein [Saprospiraceae bacterium]